MSSASFTGRKGRHLKRLFPLLTKEGLGEVYVSVPCGRENEKSLIVSATGDRVRTSVGRVRHILKGDKEHFLLARRYLARLRILARGVDHQDDANRLERLLIERWPA